MKKTSWPMKKTEADLVRSISLHDSSLIPFQTAYWLLIVLGFLILAGNTAFPIFLRCVL